MTPDDVHDALLGPLLGYVQLPEGASMRTLLDARNPARINGALRAGREQLLRSVGDALTPQTRARIDSLATAVSNLCAEAQPVWQELDRNDRNGLWEGVKAGFGEEAAAGAAIGTVLLPGIGTVVGQMIGGYLAGSEIDEAANRAAEQFDAWFDRLADEIDGRTPAIVEAVLEDLESASTDLAPAPSSRGWVRPVFATLAVLILAAVAVAFLYPRSRELALGALQARPASPASPPDLPSGRWTTPAGVVIEGAVEGDTSVFRVADSPDAPGGTLLFRLRAGAGPDDFLVEARQHRDAPAKLTWSDEAAETCNALVASANGAPLRARRTADLLEVDLPQGDSRPEMFRTRKRTIVGCLPGDPANEAKKTLLLRRKLEL